MRTNVSPGTLPPPPAPASHSFESLLQRPRFTSGNIRTHGWDLDYVDAPALHSCIDVLVNKGWNDFSCAHAAPVILDLGANVGVSALRYKQVYPGAQVIAFEPDPSICAVLRRNLAANRAADVEVVEAAVWIQDGTMAFFAEGADGSKLLLDGAGGAATSRVKTVDLARYVNRPIDLIKMDIEGAEYDVVQHLGNRLKLVRNMVIECHVQVERTREFTALLDALMATGFSVTFNTYGQWRDLVHRPQRLPNEFDQYVLVAAWR